MPPLRRLPDETTRFGVSMIMWMRTPDSPLVCHLHEERPLLPTMCWYNFLEQVFNGDITGPDGAMIEVYTAVNGSFDGLSGNFTLRYGDQNTTWPLPFNATASEVEDALEVSRKPYTIINHLATFCQFDEAPSPKITESRLRATTCCCMVSSSGSNVGLQHTNTACIPLLRNAIFSTRYSTSRRPSV